MALTQITSEGIKDGEVKNADMADDAIGVAELSATGTASSSTFLRGDNSWQAISGATDSTKMPLAGGTFTGDVTWDSATNAGRDMVWDESESDLTFNDAAYIQMGDANDLSIGHNGTTSFIQNTSSKLTIGSGGNYTTELLYGNSKKFETTSGGISITGTLGVTDTITCQANIDVGDSTSANNGRLRLGGEEDIEIYHNGTDSYLKNATGHLYIHNDDTSKGIALLSDEYWINNEANTENMIHAVHDGAVSLYHNNVKTCQTDANGIQVLGPEGGDAYLKLYADEADDNDDCWRIVASSVGNFHIQNASSGSYENNIVADGNGAVELYADNVKKLQTNSSFGTILSNTTDDANYTNVLTLARRGYEASGYGVNFKAKGGSSASQNGVLIQVSQGSGGYSDRFIFDNDGLELSDGNLKVASGHGIDFSSAADELTGASASATGSVLADYEEGTWTPTVYSTSGGTFTYANQHGIYQRVGDWVHVNGYVRATVGGTESGYARIGELPFTASDTSANYAQLLCTDYGNFDAYESGGVGGYVNKGHKFIVLLHLKEGNSSAIATSSWGTSTYMYFSVSYRVA